MSNCKWGHQIKIDSCPSCQSKAVRVSKSNNTVKLDAHWDIVNRLTSDLEAATVENKALKEAAAFYKCCALSGEIPPDLPLPQIPTEGGGVSDYKFKFTKGDET